MWHVPIDHEIFEQINPVQWLWYLHNFLKDREEEFTNNRDFVEYHASFIEPQAVQKIRESRNKTIAIDDAHFSQNIENMFGRPLRGAQNNNTEKKKHDINVNDIIKYMSELNNKVYDPTHNYKYWVDFNLE